MDKATALEVTRHLTELLRKEGLNVEQTILFGSCAIDEAADIEHDCPRFLHLVDRPCKAPRTAAV